MLEALLSAGSFPVSAQESTGFELSAEEQEYIERKKVLKIVKTPL